MAREILLEVDLKTLEMKAEAQGYHGTGCLTDVEEIQKLLGADTIDQTLKGEVQQVHRPAPLRRR